MAMPLPQNWLIWEYSKEWLNNWNYGTRILDGQLADHHDCSWHAHSMLSFLIISNVFKQIFLLIFLFQYMYHSLKPLHQLWLFITSTLAKYPGYIYRHINLRVRRVSRKQSNFMRSKTPHHYTALGCLYYQAFDSTHEPFDACYIPFEQTNILPDIFYC